MQPATSATITTSTTITTTTTSTTSTTTTTSATSATTTISTTSTTTITITSGQSIDICNKGLYTDLIIYSYIPWFLHGELTAYPMACSCPITSASPKLGISWRITCNTLWSSLSLTLYIHVSCSLIKVYHPQVPPPSVHSHMWYAYQLRYLSPGKVHTSEVL